MEHHLAAERQAAHMGRPPRLSDLPQATKLLISIMRDVQYGRFEDLPLVNGEPAFDPPPRLVRVKRLSLIHI